MCLQAFRACCWSCADRNGGANALADDDEEDAIEASDDDGFCGVPASMSDARRKRPAPKSLRPQSVRRPDNTVLVAFLNT